MQLLVRRHRLAIIPETVQDEAYLEQTLGLCAPGDVARAVRIAYIPPGVYFHSWFIQIEKVD